MIQLCAFYTPFIRLSECKCTASVSTWQFCIIECRLYDTFIILTRYSYRVDDVQQIIYLGICRTFWEIFSSRTFNFTMPSNIYIGINFHPFPCPKIRWQLFCFDIRLYKTIYFKISEIYWYSCFSYIDFQLTCNLNWI